MYCETLLSQCGNVVGRQQDTEDMSSRVKIKISSIAVQWVHKTWYSRVWEERLLTVNLARVWEKSSNTACWEPSPTPSVKTKWWMWATKKPNQWEGTHWGSLFRWIHQESKTARYDDVNTYVISDKRLRCFKEQINVVLVKKWVHMTCSKSAKCSISCWLNRTHFRSLTMMFLYRGNYLWDINV